MNTSLPHFPLTSAYYEFAEDQAQLGLRFQTEIVPMGQLRVSSGRLAIGDPLLGMTSGANHWLAIPGGSYAVNLTRLSCIDRPGLIVPAYLSLVLDAQAVGNRRAAQGSIHENDFPQVKPAALSLLIVDEDGRYIEPDDQEDHEHSLVSKSGVVSFVDEDAFERRMPDPLEIEGGWFEQFFDSQSRHGWTKMLDDEDHLVAGVANIPLPDGPDDWDEEPPTIALAQMAYPQDTSVYLEYEEDDIRRLAPIAIHIDLGVRNGLAPGGTI